MHALSLVRRSTPPLLTALALAGCASTGAANRTNAAATAATPEQAFAFRQHVDTLADPYFEGREPGTRGIDRAAEYLETHLTRIGLEPAFSASPATFRQPFEVAGDLEILEQTFAYRAQGAVGELEPESQFNPLGISGDGEASGPLVFVGYAIENGEEGYDSFGGVDDLSGKIAVMLRFEPMDESGESLWTQTNEGWTNAAGLRAKFENVLERNPAGVIFVNPPGAADPRAGVLPSTSSTRFGDRAEVPMVALSTEAADRLATLADREGRTLMDLRRAADRGEAGVIDLPYAEATISVALEQNQVDTSNVGAVLEGKGGLADEWVVVGAHYDHLGWGNVGTSRAPDLVGKRLHLGADDNASGVAGVLHVARDLRERYEALPMDAGARSVLLLLFSAEEMGLLGSQAFMDKAPIPADKIQAMLNLDMIGRLRDGELTVHGVGTATQFGDLLPPRFGASGMTVETTEGGLGPSDHASFYRGGVPVLAFFTGLHDDYHTPGDTADKVNPEGGARVASLVADIAWDLATMPERLEYVETSTQRESRPVRSGVRLGFMPGSYDETERGVLVGDVTADSAAEKAGLREGDRIVGWNGEELANIYSYMEALTGHEPGDVVRLTVLRDGEEITLEATLEASGGAR